MDVSYYCTKMSQCGEVNGRVDWAVQHVQKLLAQEQQLRIRFYCPTLDWKTQKLYFNISIFPVRQQNFSMVINANQLGAIR